MFMSLDLLVSKWDVNPPCPKVASTITILLKQKYPGSTYLPAGQRREVPPNGEVVLHWQQYPPETRDAILNEFLVSKVAEHICFMKYY